MGLQKVIVGELTPDESKAFREMAVQRGALEETLKISMKIVSEQIAAIQQRWMATLDQVATRLPAVRDARAQLDTEAGQVFIVEQTEDAPAGPVLAVDNGDASPAEPQPTPEVPPAEPPPPASPIPAGEPGGPGDAAPPGDFQASVPVDHRDLDAEKLPVEASAA